MTINVIQCILHKICQKDKFKSAHLSTQANITIQYTYMYIQERFVHEGCEITRIFVEKKRCVCVCVMIVLVVV